MAKRPRPSRVDDDEEDIPPRANYVAPPQPWVNDGAAAKEVREILDAFEVGEIDEPTRFELQRIVHRSARWL
ncbi:hypothetical protein AB4Z51_40400 [Bradyrhizobium sp. 2TAF36]|uniref:hypothetical protein n=1 Tax=Bradyrhizobium sp. 2TAF36 TaxID=3233016 RepID=UPI003F91933D